jgi:hypothetical protein
MGSTVSEHAGPKIQNLNITDNFSNLITVESMSMSMHILHMMTNVALNMAKSLTLGMAMSLYVILISKDAKVRPEPDQVSDLEDADAHLTYDDKGCPEPGPVPALEDVDEPLHHFS